MVFAAWVLAEAVGFFVAEEVALFALPRLAVLLFAAGADFVLLAVLRVLFVVLLEAVPRGLLARVLAALVFEAALLPLFARVFAAAVLPAVPVDLLVGICVSLLLSLIVFAH